MLEGGSKWCVLMDLCVWRPIDGSRIAAGYVPCCVVR